jgi:hypothetical protein
VKQRLQEQENNLKQRLTDAEQRVADNIQAIYDAQTAYAEALVQQQQDAVDAITKRYEAASAGNEIFRRMATALGNEDWLVQINAAQRDILTNQANELEGRIAAARAAGANELADQLVQQVADLRTQVFESVMQDMRDAADRVNKSAQRRMSALDLVGRMLDATGVVGQTVAGAAGLSRQGVFAARGDVLQQQRAGLVGVLGQAQAAGNLGLIQELTDQIAELDVTIAENTKAAFQARVDEVNARSGYTLGINDLNKQILELSGQISGNTDTVGLLALANERQAILTQKGNDLQQLYNEAVARGDQQAMDDLQQAILENKVAVLQNTQSINELNGSMTEPQTFTSSAWTLFREAVFTGMGQVLPQYQIPSAQTGGMVGRTGLYNLHAGELIKPAGSWSSNTTSSGDVNITVNGIEGKVDPTAIASAVGFAKKTMQ